MDGDTMGCPQSTMNSLFNELPPCPPILTRSLSHQHAALNDSAVYFDKCKEGDTIFSNYFLTHNSLMMDVEYFTRINGVIKKCQIREHYNRIISYPWTFYGTPLPSLECVNFPQMTPLENPSKPFVPLIISEL